MYLDLMYKQTKGCKQDILYDEYQVGLTKNK